MANRDRYITPQDLGGVLDELHVTGNSFQDSLLEFLERERIVVPVLRVNWPISMVIEGRNGTPEPSPTPTEREATKVLDNALRRWERFDAEPTLDHPFDATPEVAEPLLTRHIATKPFRPWDDFAINVRPDGEPPLRVPDGVDTYYHAWQALLIADAIEMGAQIITDTRRDGVFQALMEGRFTDIPRDAMRVTVSIQAPRGLREGVGWSAHFDAASRQQVLRDRLLLALSRAHRGQAFTTNADERAALVDAQTTAAARHLATLEGGRSNFIAFLRYLCERWDDWTRRGRGELAGAYKTRLAEALRLAMSGYAASFSDLASEVGRATGHFALTLDVIFPDWSTEARRKFEGSLKYSVLDPSNANGAALGLAESDIPELINWLEATDQWKVHLHVEAIIERQFKGTAVDHSGLAKEVEALGLTFEHIVSALLTDVGQSPAGTLSVKLRRLWVGRPGVQAALLQHKDLTRTETVARSAQLAAIDALSGGPDLDVTKVLLRAILYRNDGTHNAMGGWPEDELHACTRAFLSAIMLSRKSILTPPP